MASWAIYTRFMSDLYKCTVEPRCNEGPRDWQNLFAINEVSLFRGSFSYTLLLLG